MNVARTEIKLRIPQELAHKGIRSKVLHAQTIRKIRGSLFPNAEPFFTAYSGNKKALLPQYFDLLPGSIRFRSYREPFLGSGVVALSLQGRGLLRAKGTSFFEIDANNANAWMQLQENAQEVYGRLKEQFGEVTQGKFNEAKYLFNHGSVADPILRAVLTIYLANTVINGRFRCNSRGELNVKFAGRSEKKVILSEENAAAIQRALQDVEITCGDFGLSLHRAEPKGFYFIDPPYFPYVNNESNKFGSNLFSDSDYLRLVEMIGRLGDQGCLWMHSNSFYRSVAALMEWNKMPPALVYRRDLMNNFHNNGEKGSQATFIPEYVFRNYRTFGDSEYVLEAQIMKDLYDLVLEASASEEDIADLLAAQLSPLARRLRLRVGSRQEYLSAISELKRLNKLKGWNQLELFPDQVPIMTGS